MAPWREASPEKDQFGNLLKIAPFCGVQQWRLQSRDGSDRGFYDWILRQREATLRNVFFIVVEALLGSGTYP